MNMKPQFVDHIHCYEYQMSVGWVCAQLVFVRLRVPSQSCRFVVFRFQHNCGWRVSSSALLLFVFGLLNKFFAFFVLCIYDNNEEKGSLFHFFPLRWNLWKYHAQPNIDDGVPSQSAAISFRLFRSCFIRCRCFCLHFFLVHKIALNYDVDIVFHLYSLLRLFWNLPNLIFINVSTVFFPARIGQSIRTAAWFMIRALILCLLAN